jgi:hypothetical protein
MSQRDIWTSADRLATELSKSPHAVALREVFDITSHPTERPHQRVVREALAGLGMLRTRPLLLGLHLPQLPPLAPLTGYREVLATDGGEQFMDSAGRMAGALVSILEYVRSRLPDYPRIPVPDLCSGSPRVEDDGLLGGGSYPWVAAARDQGFQLSGPPPLTGLGIDAKDLHSALGDLLNALRASDAWQAFEAAAEVLDDGSRTELLTIRNEFRERTKPEVVDREAGGYLIQRAEYARVALQDSRALARSSAAVHLEAFDRVDRLIDRAASVASERVAFARPIDIPADAEVAWERSTDGVDVRAQLAHDLSDFVHPGRLLNYRGDPPAAGIWYATGMHMNFSPDLGAELTLTAFALPESAGPFDDPSG